MLRRVLRDCRGFNLMEVMVVSTLSTILLVTVVGVMYQVRQDEAKARTQALMSGTGWQVQEVLGRTLSGAPKEAVTLNPLERPQPDNLQIAWRSHDGQEEHIVLLYQEEDRFYAKHTVFRDDTETVVRSRMLAYNLSTTEGKEGVKFAWGEQEGQVMVTLTWEVEGTGKFESRSWVFSTRQ